MRLRSVGAFSVQQVTRTLPAARAAPTAWGGAESVGREGWISSWPSSSARRGGAYAEGAV